jgi:hypothetical protein
VNFYDVNTKSISKIPKSELTPGMVQAKVDGIDGIVWIDGSHVKLHEFQHDPFTGKIREDILEIQDKLHEVYPHDYEFWEDGFRRDQNPESEINLWLKIANMYEKHSSKEITLEYKQDIFKLLVACSNSEPDKVLNIVELKSISKKEAEIIIKDYYQGK